MRVAIAVDNWKLPVFRKRLKKAGYQVEDGEALTKSTTMLTVEVGDIFSLSDEIQKCQAECREKA